MALTSEKRRLSQAAGVTVVELIAVIAIVAVLTSIALVNFRKANRGTNLAGATRSLSAYLEKARVDSLRRHGGSNLVLNSASSYTANIDFSGNGVATGRTMTLPAGTTLTYSLPPSTTSVDPATTPITITYNWRGQTASSVLITLTDATAGVSPSTIIVGRAGDLSNDSSVVGPVTTPTPVNTTVTTTTAIKVMR